MHETSKKETVVNEEKGGFKARPVAMAAAMLAFVMPAFAQVDSAQIAAAQGANAGKVLYVYDEVNEQSAPYIGHYREALAAGGIAFDETTATELKASPSAVNIQAYDTIVVHAMVMAFNSKSPVRDWLKTSPDLSGKKVSLFVTANRWFLDNLYGQLTGLLAKDASIAVDAVSMATKTTTDSDERAAVEAQIARLAGK